MRISFQFAANIGLSVENNWDLLFMSEVTRSNIKLAIKDVENRLKAPEYSCKNQFVDDTFNQLKRVNEAWYVVLASVFKVDKVKVFISQTSQLKFLKLILDYDAKNSNRVLTNEQRREFKNQYIQLAKEIIAYINRPALQPITSLAMAQKFKWHDYMMMIAMVILTIFISHRLGLFAEINFQELTSLIPLIPPIVGVLVIFLFLYRERSLGVSSIDRVRGILSPEELRRRALEEAKRENSNGSKNNFKTVFGEEAWKLIEATGNLSQSQVTLMPLAPSTSAQSSTTSSLTQHRVEDNNREEGSSNPGNTASYQPT